MRVVIVDSRRGGYLDEPSAEAAVLGSLADIELLRIEDADEALPALTAADVVISWHHIALRRPVLACMNRCRGIVRASVGFDNIDLAAAAELGIPVCNVPDYGVDEVADHALALLLALARNLPALTAHTRAGGWSWQVIGPVPRLRDVRVGIVGLGRIGTAFAIRVRTLVREVVFVDPYLPSGVEKALGLRRVESLPELMRECDAVSLHVPLTEETRGLVGDAELELLGAQGLLVNTSRGEVVDQEALLRRVATERIGGAALDVLAGEPAVPAVLRESARAILTPHAAFYSTASLGELRRKAAHSARRLLLGEPVRDVVNQPASAGRSELVGATSKGAMR